MVEIDRARCAHTKDVDSIKKDNVTKLEDLIKRYEGMVSAVSKLEEVGEMRSPGGVGSMIK